MTYPLSQTPGAQRQRTWRERAMVAARLVTTERGGAGGVRKSNTSIEALTQPAPRADPLEYSLVDHEDPSRAERPCACCRKVFQPTERRRMLCLACYHKASPRDESGVIPWYQVGKVEPTTWWGT